MYNLANSHYLLHTPTSIGLSLLNYVAFVPLLTCLTCLCVSRAYVSSCLKLLRAFVPSCLKLLRPYVPTCLYIFFMPTRLRALNYFVPACTHSSRAYVPTTTHKIYWVSLLYLVLLFFSWLFDLSFHSKPQNKLLLVKLHTPILSCRVLLSACTETIISALIKKLSKTMDSFYYFKFLKPILPSLDLQHLIY